MATQLTATVVDGTLMLDRPIDLPNNTRVSVTVDTVTDEAAETPSDAERRAAWDSFLARIKEHPVHGGGQKFNRDELYEGR